MRLAISTEALPGAPMEQLLEACARRGLAGVELGYDEPGTLGVDPGWVNRLFPAAEGVEVAGCRMESDGALGPIGARMSARLRAPVLAFPEPLSLGRLGTAAELYRVAGGTLLARVPADPSAVESLAARLDDLQADSLGIALEVRPGRDDAASMIAALDAAGPHLRLVRLHGGGPEGAAQIGQGIGSLMAALALRRYGYPLVLTPSRPDFHGVWTRWLTYPGSWGCGGSGSQIGLTALAQVAAH
jgi:hypothetical protein